jgi:hypothetical protein
MAFSSLGFVAHAALAVIFVMVGAKGVPASLLCALAAGYWWRITRDDLRQAKSETPFMS